MKRETGQRSLPGSLPEPGRRAEGAIRDLVFSARGADGVALTEIQSGRNNRTFRVEDGSGTLCVAKHYFQDPGDPRDRLTTEYNSLAFLSENGVRAAPAPIAIDREAGVALYDFIDGQPVVDDDLTANDIDAAVEFLRTLKELSREPAARDLPAASDACFSGNAVSSSIQLRVRRLLDIAVNDHIDRDMISYVTGDLSTAVHTAIEVLRRTDPDYMRSDLVTGNRTLSPSDFGYHNAIRRTDGSLVFVDFEYFGWDDPAKTISDFVLHPGMSLEPALQMRFIEQSLELFNLDESLPRRLNAVFTLWGLKWCLILLNEFVPGDARRRSFAGGELPDRPDNRRKRLEASRDLLRKLVRHRGSPITDWVGL